MLTNPSNNKWKKCVYTIFGEITQPFIKTTLSTKKEHNCVSINNVYETKVDNPKKYFIVLGCVVYSIIKNYVFIDYLACR